MAMQSADGQELDLKKLAAHVEAEEFRALGDARFAQGDHEDAAVYYKMSIDMHPTAEAHVALAWTIAERGSVADAIAHCQSAAEIDPDFGNAFNDIGVYLLRQSDTEEDKDVRRRLTTEAIDYFERAIRAPRYDCRNYPYYHLGRIREQAGEFIEARNLYHQSLQIDPEFTPARVAYRRALSWLN
ncbi:MAG: tetratricopeptide repeat protein [Akkermansiaceae bacterium]|nr:tetratricopeptide repeat protein [Armatimonadota bacterium]